MLHKYLIAGTDSVIFYKYNHLWNKIIKYLTLKLNVFMRLELAPGARFPPPPPTQPEGRRYIKFKNNNRFEIWTQ